MTESITRQYDSDTVARDAVAHLKRENFSDSQISLITPARDHDGYDTETTSVTAEDAGIGAGLGGAAGAGVGLLTGLGIMAIPGVGPVVAVGWLASMAVGAIAGALAGGATGGIVGSLTGEGVSEQEANLHAEGMRRGASLVTVRAADERISDARRILDQHIPVNMTQRNAEYRAEGWSRFDEKAPPYVRADQTPMLPRPTPESSTSPHA
jgi:hypothetical protein